MYELPSQAFWRRDQFTSNSCTLLPYSHFSYSRTFLSISYRYMATEPITDMIIRNLNSLRIIFIDLSAGELRHRSSVMNVLDDES
jgi:hypothetical protein